MTDVLKYTEQLKIEAMSYGQRVLKMFQHFPKVDAYFQTLYRSVRYGKPGISFCFSNDTIRFVEIDTGWVGRLRRSYEEVEDGFFVHIFSFYVSEGIAPSMETGAFLKDQADKMCESLLPFMVSYGDNRVNIPLLVNDFPEFAKFALEYVP